MSKRITTPFDEHVKGNASYAGLDAYRQDTAKGMYNTYVNDHNTLADDYDAEVAALDAERNVARQEASINNELLMKYLPTINRMNGLHGLGVAQSFNAEALANYQNSLNDIDRTYRTSRDTLDRNFRQGSADLLDRYNTGVQSLYDQQATEDREDSLAAYNEAYDLIVAGAETKTKDEIDNYIAALDVDEATKERLGGLANYLYGDETEESDNTVVTNARVDDDRVVTVGVGARSVPLFLGGAVSLPANAVKGKEDNVAFAYENGIYIKKNGIFYQLVDENGGATSQKYSKVYNYLNNGVIPEGYGPAQSPDTPQSERYDRFDRGKSTKTPTSSIYELRKEDIDLDENRNGYVYLNDGTKKKLSPAEWHEVPWAPKEELKPYEYRNKMQVIIDGKHYWLD